MSLLVGAAANSATGGYNIDNSLRFRSSASAYLNRLPTVAGNRMTWTWSCWVKRGKLGVTQGIMGSAQGTSTSYFDTVFFDTNDKLYCRFRIPGSGDKMYRITTQVFRDLSAWYHLVFQYDTDGKTASPDNFKMYVNNELITSYVTTSGTLTTDWESFWNGLYTQVMGRRSYTPAGTYLDGYMAEVNSVDGQALLPSDFGEYNEDTGVWQPKRYTGTYGTNGFYLDFEDTSSVAALGTDSSGNGNNFTPTNISLTAGTTYDSMKDVPTLTDEDTANFATLNPLDNNGVALTEGNLTGVIAVNENVSATIAPTSGKWYWEVYVVDNTNPYIGIKKTESNTTGYTGEAVGINNAGDIYFNASNQSKDGLPGFSNTNIVGVALNVDSQKIWWSKNGQWYTADAAGESAIASSEVAAGNNGYDYSSQITNAKPYVGSSASNGSVTLNFGQRPFSYTPPTGFLKLNTFNLPDSTITDGSKYFNTVLYTGTGATRSVTGVGFQPDWIWIKNRAATYYHNLSDTVRGITRSLSSNATDAEVNFGNISAVGSDGFTVSGAELVNNNAQAIVAWNWKAGGTAVSNSLGDITTSVSANTDAGFSIVTWTKNGGSGARTIGHGLGGVPQVVFFKEVDDPSNWSTYVGVAGSTTRGLLYLNLSAAQTTNDANQWSDTAPTSTVFTYNQTYSFGSNSSATMLGYFFRSIEGYSKFGSYTGNGSTDGAFVYTGFKPKMVIIKVTSAVFDWVILDTERNPENLVHDVLYPSLVNAEADATTYASFDAVSNGFKLRNAHQYTNYNGYNYLYMAFAENPFKNSTAR